MKLQAFDLNYVCGKSHFEDDGTQNDPVFYSAFRYFKTVANTSKVKSWKSKGLCDESFKLPSTSEN